MAGTVNSFGGGRNAARQPGWVAGRIASLRNAPGTLGALSPSCSPCIMAPLRLPHRSSSARRLHRPRTPSYGRPHAATPSGVAAMSTAARLEGRQAARPASCSNSSRDLQRWCRDAAWQPDAGGGATFLPCRSAQCSALPSHSAWPLPCATGRHMKPDGGAATSSRGWTRRRWSAGQQQSGASQVASPAAPNQPWQGSARPLADSRTNALSRTKAADRGRHPRSGRLRNAEPDRPKRQSASTARVMPTRRPSTIRTGPDRPSSRKGGMSSGRPSSAPVTFKA